MVALGGMIAAQLPRAGTVLLSGELGAGKTTLAKGIAAARAGVSPDEVSSPTFTLIHEYGDPVTVYHIDLYRLDEEREVLGLGLDELFDRDALVLVEWGEKFPRLMPADARRILIRYTSEGREVELSEPWG